MISIFCPPPASICNGSIRLDETTGEICIDGRVNYQQLWEFLGNKAVYQPAARTISINGHLTAGSGNVVLGKSVRYLYDFVTSYTLNGVNYTADESIVDNLLAASRGTIDGLCLSADFQQAQATWYQVSHQLYRLNAIDYNNLRTNENMGLLFFGKFNSVLEYHTPVAEPNFFVRALSRLSMNFVNSIVYLFPSFLYGLFPVFAITGTSRLVVKGKFSTKEFPNPLIAPDSLGPIEGVQVDTTWDNLVTAIETQGLFRKNRVPLYFNVVIKPVMASGKNYKCWGEGTQMAAIDIEAPAGQGQQMDDFIQNTVYPALAANNKDVSIHFGKRSPPNSLILQSALNLYEKCGVKVGLTVDPCYHPICERKVTPSNFRYPEAYYE